MTIRFITAWNGYYEGQIVTNPNGGNSEATLISLGFAVADLGWPNNSPVPVYATTNPLTGGIEINGTPAPAYIWAGGPHRKRALSFGCSISQQSNVFCHSSQSTVAGSDHRAGVFVLNVANGAAFAPGQIVTIPLYNGRLWNATISSIATNALTVADRTPGLIRLNAVVTINATGTFPSLDQGHGALNAGVACGGGSVEVVSSYGYGGAIHQQMAADLERDLRYYRPHYVMLHMFENDMTSAAGASLESMKAWSRQVAQMCLSYGATPIVASAMPYYNGSIGVPSSRAAAFDGLLGYLCTPVANGKSQIQIDVPGSHGIDLSTPWLDPAYLNDSGYSRRPLPGWTDGVHPNTNKRFAIGSIVADYLAGITPPAGSLLDYSLSKREYTLLEGSGGSPTNLTGGSISPTGHVTVAYGTAVVGTSRNQDGSMKFVGAWPGAASRNVDNFLTRYAFTFPSAWSGSTQRFKVYARFRINSMVGIAQIYPYATLSSGEDHQGQGGIDVCESMPSDGRIIVLETPHFQMGEATTSVTIAWIVKPKDAVSPANASINIDVIELGLMPCMPEVPHDFI